MTPRQTEPSANIALGRLLQRMLPTCQVRTENTQAIAGQPGLRPDVLITATGRAPVVIEAEFAPAASAEAEARERLGLHTTADGRPVEAVVALRYPASVADAEDLESELADVRLSYGVFTQDGAGPGRFPASGWLDGSVADLADLVRLVSAPQHAVDRAAEILEEGIDRAERILNDVAKLRPASARAVAGLLGMTNAPHARRMAGAIIANALIFHERLVGTHDAVKPLDLVGIDSNGSLKREILTVWSDILKINYWPIFAVARDIVGQLESWDAAQILRTLRGTATEIRTAGVDNAHDLTGRVFQRLIADRKYLATFYTLPASAALLARLAVAKLDGVDWSDADEIGKLRVGDFACGTGALLSAVYEQIAARHERTGGDAAALHAVMMEEVLYGCDVMPSAIHITGSTLAGMQPSGRFENSRLYPLPYGRQRDGSVAIGSLELLQSSQVLTLINTSDPARRTGSMGEETAAQIVADISDEGFDLVIMNPPFTRNTTHEGAYSDVSVAAFAAFNASESDQRDMAKRMQMLKRDTCYHGNAGIASAFAALGDRKLKPGGVLALVLPLSAAAGVSWRSFRDMLGRGYANVSVLSIAATNREMSFSSDTGMAECLVIARKRRDGEPPASRVHFTSLARRPQGFAHAAALAGASVNGADVHGIEDGPYGGTPLKVGEEPAGWMLTSSSGHRGSAWSGVRLADYSIAQTAYALSDSRLWLPGSSAAIPFEITTLSSLGQLGAYHLDIIGAPPRGPFSKEVSSPTATYPALWNHDARKETRIVCDPDSQLLVRMGMEAKAAAVWELAGRAHLNLDFTFGSQALAVAFTERNSIGGRVWPNVNFSDKRFDFAFAVWSNSSLGLISYWWHASRQQSSKATMTIRSAESLPVLDFRNLNDRQLITAQAIFDEFRDKELQPAYLTDADPNRALLDRRVACDLLGFGEDIYEGVRRLASKWCAEPSVHGGKQRPPGSDLVI